LSAGDLGGPFAVAAAAAVISIGLSLLHPFWIVVGLAGIAVGAYQYFKARRRKAAEHADAAARMDRLREQATQAAAELAAYTATDAERAAAIATDLGELRKRLTA
jgi:type III secretory pathway component EscV